MGKKDTTLVKLKGNRKANMGIDITKHRVLVEKVDENRLYL